MTSLQEALALGITERGLPQETTSAAAKVN